MNTTTESKSPGQIAFETYTNVHYSDQPGQWKDNLWKDHWEATAQSVIASLPRAGVRVLTAEDLRRILDQLPAARGFSFSFLELNQAVAFANTLLSATPPTEPTADTQRLDWLDQHCAFVADSQFNIGPYKIGELRKMADDGIEQSARLKEPTKPEQEWEERTGVHAKHEGWKRSECQFRWGTSGEWAILTTENDPDDQDGFYPQCFYRRRQPRQESGERGTDISERITAYLTSGGFALRLQLANAMVERDQMNEERDAALERVRELDKSLLEMTNARNVFCESSDSFAKELTASQAELAETKELLRLQTIQSATYGLMGEKDLAKIADLTSEMAEVKDRLMGALFDKEQAINKQAELIGECESLTAKLKAAEEKKEANVRAAYLHIQEGEKLRTTISRLEGELNTVHSLGTVFGFEGSWSVEQVLTHAEFANSDRIQKMVELASLKSQLGGRVTEAVLSDALPKNHGLSTSQLSAMLIYLNHHLAPIWLPISTPPTEADADRNGNVEWLCNNDAVFSDVWNYFRKDNPLADPEFNSYIPWRHTNLPDLPAESRSDVECEKWIQENADMLSVEKLRKPVVRSIWHDAIASVKGEK